MEISCDHSGLVDVRPIFVGVMVTLSMEEALRDVELQPDPIKYFSDKMDNHAQYIIEGTNLFSFNFYLPKEVNRNFILNRTFAVNY